MTFLELHFGRRRFRADKCSEEPSPAQEDAGCYDTDPSAISSGCTMVLKALEVFDIQHSGKVLLVSAAVPGSHNSHVLWVSGSSRSTYLL